MSWTNLAVMFAMQGSRPPRALQIRRRGWPEWRTVSHVEVVAAAGQLFKKSW